jgi:NTP pyrophosphatase (non-canonical NTP hydrolase)
MTPNDYQRKALERALPRCKNLNYMIHGLTNEAGEVSGKFKKWLREDMTEAEMHVALIAELGDVQWYLAGAASMIGIDLDVIMKYNLDKLNARHERGTIQGNGDNR